MRDQAIAAASTNAGIRSRGEAQASTVAQAKADDAWPEGKAAVCGTSTSGFGSE